MLLYISHVNEFIWHKYLSEINSMNAGVLSELGIVVSQLFKCISWAIERFYGCCFLEFLVCLRQHIVTKWLVSSVSHPSCPTVSWTVLLFTVDMFVSRGGVGGAFVMGAFSKRSHQLESREEAPEGHFYDLALISHFYATASPLAGPTNQREVGYPLDKSPAHRKANIQRQITIHIHPIRSA